MSQKHLNNFIEHRLQTVILARDYGVNAYSNRVNNEENIFLPIFTSCTRYEYYSTQVKYFNVFPWKTSVNRIYRTFLCKEIDYDVYYTYYIYYFFQCLVVMACH